MRTRALYVGDWLWMGLLLSERLEQLERGILVNFAFKREVEYWGAGSSVRACLSFMNTTISQCCVILRLCCD